MKSILNIVYILVEKNNVWKVRSGEVIRWLLKSRIQNRVFGSLIHNLQGYIHPTKFMSFPMGWKYHKFQVKFNDHML